MTDEETEVPPRPDHVSLAQDGGGHEERQDCCTRKRAVSAAHGVHGSRNADSGKQSAHPAVQRAWGYTSAASDTTSPPRWLLSNGTGGSKGPRCSVVLLCGDEMHREGSANGRNGNDEGRGGVRKRKGKVEWWKMGKRCLEQMAEVMTY